MWTFNFVCSIIFHMVVFDLNQEYRTLILVTDTNDLINFTANHTQTEFQVDCMLKINLLNTENTGEILLADIMLLRFR